MNHSKHSFEQHEQFFSYLAAVFQLSGCCFSAIWLLFVHQMTKKARHCNMKRLYEITRSLSGKIISPNKPVKDNEGKTIAC
jgi:hypothetical protein